MIRRPPRSTLFPYRRSSDLVQREARRPHPVGPPLEQLVARHAPAEVVAGRGDVAVQAHVHAKGQFPDRKSTRLNSSHANISYAVFCLKKHIHAKTSGGLCAR